MEQLIWESWAGPLKGLDPSHRLLATIANAREAHPQLRDERYLAIALRSTHRSVTNPEQIFRRVIVALWLPNIRRSDEYGAITLYVALDVLGARDPLEQLAITLECIKRTFAATSCRPKAFQCRVANQNWDGPGTVLHEKSNRTELLIGLSRRGRRNKRHGIDPPRGINRGTGWLFKHAQSELVWRTMTPETGIAQSASFQNDGQHHSREWQKFVHSVRRSEDLGTVNRRAHAQCAASPAYE